MPNPHPLPGRWHTGPTVEVYAHGEETPRRVAILNSDQVAGVLALFPQAGHPVEVDPNTTYRVEIEQIDARKSATAGDYVPYEPARRRVSMLRSDQMGQALARYIPQSDASPVVLDPGAAWRVTIQVEPTTA
jgi:hypothetical protein